MMDETEKQSIGYTYQAAYKMMAIMPSFEYESRMAVLKILKELCETERTAIEGKN